MKTRILILLLLLSFKTTFSQEITKKTIDISGNQRMYSQRIAKNAVMTLINQKFQDFDKKVKIDKVAFTRQLGNLYKKAENNNNLLLKLDLEKIAWLNFSNDLEKIESDIPKKIENILKSCTDLLKAADVVTKEFELKLSKASNAKIINTAGKQRMLSQRLCLYYAALNTFHNLKERRLQKVASTTLKDIFSEMDNVISDFFEMEYINDDIENQVLLVAAVFQDLKDKEIEIEQGLADLKFVYETTNKLLYENNVLTRLLTKVE